MAILFVRLVDSVNPVGGTVVLFRRVFSLLSTSSTSCDSSGRFPTFSQRLRVISLYLPNTNP